jgi:hypothetical protein
MKKLSIAILLTLTMISFAPEKKLKVELPLNIWSKHLQKLEVVRGVIEETNLPHQQVTFVTRTIDSLEMDLYAQLTPQVRLADSIAKAEKDSVKKK